MVCPKCQSTLKYVEEVVNGLGSFYDCISCDTEYVKIENKLHDRGPIPKKTSGEITKTMESLSKTEQLIKMCIAKGCDIEFSECPDFHDAETFNITIVDSNETYLYESEGVSYSHITTYNKVLDTAIEIMSKQER